MKYIDGHSYGEVVSRVIADVDQFADGLADGIYPVIYRCGNDPWNVLFYAICKCKNYGSCRIDYAGVIFCGELYCKENLSDV